MHKKEPLYSLRYDLYLHFCLGQLKKTLSGADPGFLQRGGCKYESSRAKVPGQRNGGERTYITTHNIIFGMKKG